LGFRDGGSYRYDQAESVDYEGRHEFFQIGGMNAAADQTQDQPVKRYDRPEIDVQLEGNYKRRKH